MQQEKPEHFSFAVLNNNLNLLHRLLGAINLLPLASQSRTPLLFLFPQATGTISGSVLYEHPVLVGAGITFLRSKWN